MADVNANINVTVNTSQAVAQLRKLTSEINRFNQQSFAANSAAAQQQRALNQALVDGVRTSGHFRTSITPVISAVDQFSNSIEKGRLGLGQYTRYAASQLPGMRRVFTREFDMISRVAEDRVRKLNTQFVSLGESANGMQRALAMTPTALNQFSAQSAVALQRQQIFNKLLRDGSTQLLNWGKNTQWAGRQLMVGFSIPLALLGAQAAKVFKELEAQALSFKKVYGDIFTTDVEREENLAAIKELAAEMTKYGQSAKQTMEIANTAAAAGSKGAELLAATTQATRLAVLGQMEQNQAIEATISLQTAFAMSNEELAQSINFLNMVENQTILSLDDITEAIPRVASVIKGFGGTVEDLSVLLVAMKEGGVSAAEGANALKNSMARVISPTRNALDVSAKYGIALQDIVRRNEGKVVPLFQELAKALEALGGQPRQEVLSAIFGKYQYARIGTLLSNITKEGSQAATAIGLTAMETRDLAAAAERELSVVEESISTKFTAAVEKAKIALAPVGAEFLKALTPVLEVIGKLLSSFNDLPGGIKTAIVAATGIIGGLAPVLLMVVGLLGNGIANIAKFVLFLRKQMATLRGNGEQFKFYTSAELEAAAAAASLEGRTSSLTKSMLLQKPAIESLIGLYTRLAGAAAAVTAAMPTTMGMPAATRVATKGGGFAAVAPPLPAVYRRNAGGPIFESRGGKTIVPGVGNTDTVPAMLTPGEFVINKEATRKNLPLIEAINSGGIGLRSKSSGIPVTGQGVQSFLLGSQVAKIVGAHASTQMALRGKNRLAFLGGAERALVKANRNAVVLGLDRSMLNIDDRYNQLMKSGGRGVNDVTGFAKHIRNRKDLFDKMPEIAGLPSSVKNEFRTLIANKISTTKPPITDAKFAKAYNSAISEMRKNLKGNKSNLSLFDEAVAATRQLSQTRVLFKPPRGTNVPRLNGANEAKSAMKNFGLSDSVKNGNPFYYVDTKSGKTSAIVWNEDTGRYVSVTTDSTRKIAKSRMPKPVQRKNKGGMIAGTQYLMAGRMVQPYVRPKKPAGPRATELEKALMQKRANAKVASGKQLDDLIFRRDKNGKLDLDSTELLTMLSSNPNITDRQLSQISKYHGSRIKTGMFGRFDKDAGIRFRDSDWGAWKDIAKIMQERGFPIVQSRNKGGMISGVQHLTGGASVAAMTQAAMRRAEPLEKMIPSMSNIVKMRSTNLGTVTSTEMLQLNRLMRQGRYDDVRETLQMKQIPYREYPDGSIAIIQNDKLISLNSLRKPTSEPAGTIPGLGMFKRRGPLSSDELVELNKLAQQGKYSDIREVLTTRGIPFTGDGQSLSIIHNDKLVNLSTLGRNKGGMIPGVQYFNAAMAQRVVQAAATPRALGDVMPSMANLTKMRRSTLGMLSSDELIQLNTLISQGRYSDAVEALQLKQIGYKASNNNKDLIIVHNGKALNLGTLLPPSRPPVGRISGLPTFSKTGPLSSNELVELNRLMQQGRYDDVREVLTTRGIPFRSYTDKEINIIHDGKLVNLSNIGKNKGGAIRKYGFGGFINKMFKANRGRMVPGVGSKDTVPAMLTPGEFVVNKKSTQENLPLLHAINDGNVQRLQNGTEVQEATQTRRTRRKRQRAGRGRLPGETRLAFREEIARSAPPTGSRYTEERFRRAELARAERAARTGFQVQREHVESKTRFGGGSTRWGTGPENQLSNILKNSERTRNEYLKRLDSYFEEEKRRVQASDRRQKQKDRMQSNLDKQRDRMIEKVNNNFALNAKERQIQSRVLTTMVKDVKSGKLTSGRAGQVSANFSRVAGQVIGAAKSYMAPSRPGLPGAVPLGEPIKPPTPIKTPTATASIRMAKEQYRQSVSQSKIETKLAQQQEQRLAREAKLNDVQKRALEIRRSAPGTSTAQAMEQARKEMGVVKQGRMARIGGKIGAAGMGVGMGLSMASMLPMMAQDEQGKFMGMDATTSMMGLMGAGTLLSLLPMLKAGFVVPVLAAGAAIGAVAIGIKIFNDRLIESAEKAAEFGSNVGGTANALNTMSALFGEKTPAQRATQMQLQFSAPEQEQAFGEFQNYLSSELGTKFIKDFESLTSAERFKKLSDYIRNAVAAGVFDNQKAILFAKTMGATLNDAVLGTAVIADLRKNVQQTGAKGLLGLAETRQAAVEERATVNQSEMIGSSIQIIQDYANALALANEEFAAGTMTYKEFTRIAQQAKTAQAEYSKELTDSLLTSGEAALGIIKQNIVTIEANAAAFNREMSNILSEEQMAAMKKATETGARGFQGFGPAIGGYTEDAFEGVMKAQIGTAIAAGVDPDQAIAIAQEIRDNPEGKLGQTYARLISQGSENALVVSAFEETSDVMAESLGLTGQMNEKFKELGRTFLEAGNNVGELQTFLGNLPENLRNSMINSLANMSAEAQKTVVTGGTAISGAFGERSREVFSSSVYQRALKATEGRRVRGGIIGVSEEDVKNLRNVQQSFVDLQENFGEDVALQISIAANTKENDEDVSIPEWNNNVEDLSKKVENIQRNFPPEILSNIEIRYTDPKDIEKWSNASEVFAKNVDIISKLNPNIDISAVMSFLTVDADGNKLTQEQVLANTVKLNKAWSQLESSKNINIRRQATITIISAYEDAQGNRIDPALADPILKDLQERFGKKIYDLGPVILYQAVNSIIDAKALKDQAKTIRAAAAQNPELHQFAGRLEAQAAALEGKGAGIVEAAISQTAGAGPSGGAGGAEDSLKSFVQGIVDQAKIWADANAKMSDLNNLKGIFAKTIMKGQGLFDKLKNVKGISGSQLQEIVGLGPKGMKKFIDQYVKEGKLTEKGIAILRAQLRVGGAQTVRENIIATQMTKDQTQAARAAIRMGARKDIVEAISGDPAKAAQFNAANKKGKQEILDTTRQQIDANKKLEDTLNPQQVAVEKIRKEHEATVKIIDKQIEKQEEVVQKIQDQIDELERKNSEDQWTIRNKEREKELIDRQIESLERANEMDGRRIETLQRQDELRNREADALSNELQAMSDVEGKIRESYQKRIDALDKVTQLNDHILQQERQRLGLSQALSQGDIFAATAAAQEMRQTQVQFAQQQVRAGLEQGMENTIAGLRTSGGLTREQAEAQIKQIKEQSYQTSLLIRDIEDQIYTRTQQMIPLRDQQRAIDLEIRTISDGIFNRETDIYNIRTQQLEPQQNILDNLNKEKSDMQKITDEVINQIEALDTQAMGVNEVTKRVDELAQAWAEVERKIADANMVARTKTEDLGSMPTPKAGQTSAEYKAEVEKWRKKRDEINAKRDADVAAAFSEGNKAMESAAATTIATTPYSTQQYYQMGAVGGGGGLRKFAGGRIKKYPMGGLIPYADGGKVFGRGGMDSVNALLTPGEFVVRRAMVDKYGIPMMNALNQGSFGMPRYNVGQQQTGNVTVKTQNTSSVMAPMYNNYSVNVSVSGTNASADEIANRTIMKIKQMQDMQIRSGRGY